jgi:hypothetical protein
MSKELQYFEVRARGQKEYSPLTSESDIGRREEAAVVQERRKQDCGKGNGGG